jgi:hypothetical protein
VSLILDGTNGLSDVDGSASTPAIRGTDTNTGIFFPAADTIAFAEGGAEVARFDSSGNLGIGTSSPSNKLDIVGSAARISNAGTANFATRNSTAGVNWEWGVDGSGNGFVYTGQSSALVFSNNAAERMRIDSSGNLLVGVTSPIDGSHSFRSTSDGSAAGAFYRPTANTVAGVASFWSNVSSTQSLRAYFAANGGLYNFSANNVNLSDRREKTNFEPSEDYLAKICAIPVQTFNYINEESDGKTLGVVAQDVQAVAPELITESNWGTEEEPKMRLSIYQTDLQYALMKCIQEQQAIITDLKSRIETLEAK